MTNNEPEFEDEKEYLYARAVERICPGREKIIIPNPLQQYWDWQGVKAEKPRPTLLRRVLAFFKR